MRENYPAQTARMVRQQQPLIMLVIKIILGSPFDGIDSGAPLRYIGLMNELCKRYKLSIFAPGNTELLKKAFPDAIVCPTTSSLPKLRHFSISKYLCSFIDNQFTCDKIYFPGFNYFPDFKKLLETDTGNHQISFYFGLNSYVMYSDIDRVPIHICDLCDSKIRLLRGNKKQCVTIKEKTLNFLDEVYIKKLKRHYLPHNPVLLAIAEEDARYISKTLKNKKIHVIPNGTNLPQLKLDDAFYRKKHQSSNIVFLGNLNYEPNIRSLIYSLDLLWPSIYRMNPIMRFRIVGRYATPELRNKATTVPGVEMIGEVENIYPYLIDAKAFLAPMLSGSGMKNKFLEALSVGTPIITNREGAEGIDLISGKQGSISETPEGMIQALEDILNAPIERYSHYIDECLALAQKYTWEYAGNKLHSVIEGAGAAHDKNG